VNPGRLLDHPVLPLGLGGILRAKGKKSDFFVSRVTRRVNTRSDSDGVTTVDGKPDGLNKSEGRLIVAGSAKSYD